jgi:hypothetical protein
VPKTRSNVTVQLVCLWRRGEVGVGLSKYICLWHTYEQQPRDPTSAFVFVFGPFRGAECASERLILSPGDAGATSPAREPCSPNGSFWRWNPIASAHATRERGRHGCGFDLDYIHSTSVGQPSEAGRLKTAGQPRRTRPASISTGAQAARNGPWETRQICSHFPRSKLAIGPGQKPAFAGTRPRPIFAGRYVRVRTRFGPSTLYALAETQKSLRFSKLG